jgi:cobalt-zinc-cadmium efflux system membrane fusion protein
MKNNKTINTIMEPNVGFLILRLKFQSVFFLKIIFSLLLLAIVSCKKQPEEVAEEINTVQSVKNKDIIEFTKEQVQAIDLRLGSFEEKNLATTLKINGKLTLPPQYRSQVSILTGGIVKNIFVQEGEFVAKGKILATIMNAEILQLQQDYLENNANLTYLDKEYQRQKELRADNINAGKTYQQAEREFQISLTKKAALKSKLTQLGINVNTLTIKNIATSIAISAPISGYIQHINLNIGKYADVNSVLFEIINNHFLHLDLKVFEKDLHKIKEGQSIVFNDANDVLHSHPAIIYAINKSFEADEQAVLVHAKINEVTETLLPGMYVEARVNINNSMVKALPSEAIVNNGNEHYIFIEKGKNVFQQIKVTLGVSDMGYTQVIPLGKIASNGKVVVKGAYYLLSELTKGNGEE